MGVAAITGTAVVGNENAGVQLRWFFCFYLVYEVTYVMDRTSYLAADVGFGTRVWRGRESRPHPTGGRTRGIGTQRSSGTPRCLASLRLRSKYYGSQTCN